MKAKYYIGILSFLLLPGSVVTAQRGNDHDYRNDNATVVVNNYYDNYDYYYASRINRFHRSYTAFNYYAPVFTETYWYNFQPYSWGLSIYGGGGGIGFRLGYSYNYPVYNYGYGYYDGWYDPYFGASYYYGYDPFYYNNWYAPTVISISVRNRWSNNYYYSNSSGRYSSTRSSSANSSRRQPAEINSRRSDENRANIQTKSNNSPGVRTTSPANTQVNRRVTTQPSSGRSTGVSSGKVSSPSRSVSTPTRSSSSRQAPGSVSKASTSSSRSSAKASSSKSSGSDKKSSRRK